MRKKQNSMRWKEAKGKLTNGRPSARKTDLFVDGNFVTRFRPTVGGIWVKALTGDDSFENREAAIQAAGAVKAHWIAKEKA
jgi:hypothetical protein